VKQRGRNLYSSGAQSAPASNNILHRRNITSHIHIFPLGECYEDKNTSVQFIEKISPNS
jgi:hypothetical protein